MASQRDQLWWTVVMVVKVLVQVNMQRRQNAGVLATHRLCWRSCDVVTNDTKFEPYETTAAACADVGVGCVVGGGVGIQNWTHQDCVSGVVFMLCHIAEPCDLQLLCDVVDPDSTSCSCITVMVPLSPHGETPPGLVATFTRESLERQKGNCFFSFTKQ